MKVWTFTEEFGLENIYKKVAQYQLFSDEL